MHYKDVMAQRYAELVYYGQWFTPLRKSMDAFFTETQKVVSGSISLKMYKGGLSVCGRKSPNSLYREEFATFGYSEVYDHTDAAGFIRLFSPAVQGPGYPQQRRQGYSRGAPGRNHP